jgi:hypothetical protein
MYVEEDFAYLLERTEPEYLPLLPHLPSFLETLYNSYNQF